MHLIWKNCRTAGEFLKNYENTHSCNASQTILACVIIFVITGLKPLYPCAIRVQYILNVTREIDNFFPGLFEYHNIRVYDEEATDLLAYWNDTYKFISRAK